MESAEEKYRIIIENAGEAILVAQDRKFKLVNPKASELLGFPPEEIRSRPFTDFIHPEDRNLVLRRYVGRLKGEDLPSRYPFRIIDSRNSEKWVEVNVVPISWEGHPATLSFMRDITDRKKDEQTLQATLQALRESNQLFNSAVQSARAGVWDYDVESGETYYSPSWKKQLGYEEDEQINTLNSATDLLHPDDRERVLDYLAAYLANPAGDFEIEFQIRHRDGSFRWINSRAAAFLNDDGWVKRLLGFHFDVTERKAAEARMADLSNRLREYDRLLDLTQVLIRDPENRIVYWNKGNERLYGWSREEAQGRKVGELFHTGYPQPFEQIEDELMEKGSWDGELTRSKKDGSRITVASHWVLERDRAGNPQSVLEVDNDITALKQAESEIRRLGFQLVQAQEEERKKIARELHDVIGQNLSLVIMGVDGLSGRVSKELPELRSKFNELSRTLKESINSIRELSYFLNPPGLHEFGLLNTVRKLIREVALEKNMEIDFSSTGVNEDRLGPEIQLAVFRLIQEAMLNVAKHAGAGKATVRLVKSFPHLILRIEDDGCGFDVEERLVSAQAEKHFGLRNMMERVALLGGRLEVKSAPWQGTRLSIQLPLEGEKNGR